MPRQENSFTKAFLPGLILGIVVGGFAGAYLTGGTGGTIEPPKAGASTGSSRPRDSGETPVVNPAPVIEQGAGDGGNVPAATDPNAPAKDLPKEPAADPKAPPATPPASDPGTTPAANPKPVEPK